MNYGFGNHCKGSFEPDTLYVKNLGSKFHVYSERTLFPRVSTPVRRGHDTNPMLIPVHL